MVCLAACRLRITLNWPNPTFATAGRNFPTRRNSPSQQLKKTGAFFADVADRHGYNDTGTKHNQTPGAQIALDFWRQYIYTGDETFLRDAAWPVIREVTQIQCRMPDPGAGRALSHLRYERL